MSLNKSCNSWPLEGWKSFRNSSISSRHLASISISKFRSFGSASVPGNGLRISWTLYNGCRRSSCFWKRGLTLTGSLSPKFGETVRFPITALGQKRKGLNTEQRGFGVAVNQWQLGLPELAGYNSETWLPVVALAPRPTRQMQPSSLRRMLNIELTEKASAKLQDHDSSSNNFYTLKYLSLSTYLYYQSTLFCFLGLNL